MKIPYDAGVQYCLARGVNAYSSTDTDFGTLYVYCDEHLRVHSTGWCTVDNYRKVALDFATYEDAQTEAERMGLT